MTIATIKSIRYIEDYSIKTDQCCLPGFRVTVVENDEERVISLRFEYSKETVLKMYKQLAAAATGGTFHELYKKTHDYLEKRSFGSIIIG